MYICLVGFPGALPKKGINDLLKLYINANIMKT